MMNEQDKALADAVIKKANSWSFIFASAGDDELRSMIMTALTTARKEARTAAFKDARRIAHRRIGLMTNGNESWLTAERVEELCDEINEHFEAAANSEEGAGNG